MIGFIQGTLISKKPPIVIINVNGIGYEISIPMTTLYQMPAIGEVTQLFTHLTVRDDAHLLYGFANETEKELFRELIKVNGVGSKVALGILSGMDGKTFAFNVIHGDVSSLVKLPGIGKKTAERLIIEMRDRLEKLEQFADLDSIESSPTSGSSASSARKDAISALESLGYKAKDAEKAIRSIKDDLSSEEFIRLALKKL